MVSFQNLVFYSVSTSVTNIDGNLLLGTLHVVRKVDSQGVLSARLAS